MFLEECEEEIITLFRVQFRKEVSEVDILNTVDLEKLIFSLLDRSNISMQFAHSINS